MIHWTCPSCSEPLEAPDALCGDAIECPVCMASVLVPVPMVAPAVTSVFDIELGAPQRQALSRPQPSMRPHPVMLHPPCHPRRLIIAIAAGIGMSATFMPWIRAPIIGSVSGVGGDGWFTFAAFLAVLALTFSLRIFDHPGAPSSAHSDLSGRRRVVIALLGLVGAGIGVLKLVQVHDVISEMRDTSNAIAGIMATATQPGFGPYAIVLCGIAVFIAAGQGVRIASGSALALLGTIALLVVAAVAVVTGLQEYQTEFTVDWPALQRLGVTLLLITAGGVVFVLAGQWLRGRIPEWWRLARSRYAQRLLRERLEEERRAQALAKAERDLRRLKRPPT